MTAMADHACHPRETAVLAALKAGDEATFAALVDEHTPLMLRLARGMCSDAFRCRGSRARGLDRLHRGLGTIRGEMLAEDLAAPDRRQPGSSARPARASLRHVLVPRGRSVHWNPRQHDRGRSRRLARVGCRLSLPVTSGPGHRRRDAREARDGDRLPPRSPTGCDRAAGCRRLVGERSVHDARHDRRQPDACCSIGLGGACGAHSSHISSSLILELSGAVPRRCNQKNRKETVNRC